MCNAHKGNEVTKTIAFCWIYPLNAASGGVERLTLRLMEGLSKRGYDCLFLQHDIKQSKYLLGEKDVGDLDEYLCQRNVNVLINQNGQSDQMAGVLMQSRWEGSYIVCHHVEPYYLRKIYNVRQVLVELCSFKNTLAVRLAWLARLLSYPLWQKFSTRKISKAQARNYGRADRYVLLSRAFQPELVRLLGQQSLPKVVALPNPLSFEIEPSEAKAWEKKFEVLIVSRLSEGQKRISAALEAWRIIENQDRDGWTLKIVGDGPDAGVLQKKAQALGLKRVAFLGRQDPLPHYRTASIFLMTSRVEGWGLTLTEAMQAGVAPIVFDSYASLRDIVDDGETGIIVPNGNIEVFAEEAINLMINHARRKSIAANAIASIQKFRLETVLDQWETIL